MLGRHSEGKNLTNARHPLKNGLSSRDQDIGWSVPLSCDLRRHLNSPRQAPLAFGLFWGANSNDVPNTEKQEDRFADAGQCPGNDCGGEGQG